MKPKEQARTRQGRAHITIRGGSTFHSIPTLNQNDHCVPFSPLIDVVEQRLCSAKVFVVEQWTYQDCKDRQHGHQRLKAVSFQYAVLLSLHLIFFPAQRCLIFNCILLQAAACQAHDFTSLGQECPSGPQHQSHSVPFMPSFVRLIHFPWHGLSLIDSYCSLLSSPSSENYWSALKLFWLLNQNLSISHCWHHLTSPLTCQEASEPSSQVERGHSATLRNLTSPTEPYEGQKGGSH